MDGQTDGPTDRRMDRASYIDARMHLKTLSGPFRRSALTEMPVRFLVCGKIRVSGRKDSALLALSSIPFRSYDPKQKKLSNKSLVFVRQLRLFQVIASKRKRIGCCGLRHWKEILMAIPMPQTAPPYLHPFRSYDPKETQLSNKNLIFVSQLRLFQVIASKRKKIGCCGLQHWKEILTVIPMPQTTPP